MWLLSIILPDPLPHRKKEFKKRDLFYLAALLLLPLVWSDPHLHHLMVLAGINAILALGLSLFLGYAGQISLGHAAFFGIGAYTTAILTTRYAFPPFVAFWASAVAAAIMAYLIGKTHPQIEGILFGCGHLGIR